ncbi:alpha/beta fold hydrolase, partial [Agrobacterium cavarae]
MHFDLHGRQDADAPTIILSSGLGGSASYWAPQLAALSDDYRIVTYDHRGCGRTGGEVPADGGIAAMADDVLEIAEQLGL